MYDLPAKLEKRVGNMCKFETQKNGIYHAKYCEPETEFLFAKMKCCNFFFCHSKLNLGL